MAAALRSTDNHLNPVHHADHAVSSRCRQRRMFGRMNLGPRFYEGNLAVTHNFDSVAARQSQKPDETGSNFIPPPKNDFSLYYRVYNPASLHSLESPPLVVVHGGPSLPSDYLYPLVENMPTSRSIVFYDQIGCGRSSQPKAECMYSIENIVADLEKLILSLKLTKFHLLGHSFGGIIAYEFMKKHLDELSNNKENKIPFPCTCLSAILSNTPSNMKTSLREYAQLEEKMKHELDIEINNSDVDFDCGSSFPDSLLQERLRKRYECRTEKLPEPLLCAIKNRGTVWTGPEVIHDYIARPPSVCFPLCCDASEQIMPPVLLIRGEFDFINEKCIEGWRDIFSNGNAAGIRNMAAYREETMINCSHYCHLEDSRTFLDLVKNHCFIHDY